ncbi:riboflavin biosynthesis protein RibF [Aeromicrobium sp. PE09-221]|uniref:bifunctional riboflavin kinase/FAD synthetase n=1 Tax=Aeromicrobium sp. PE09-221 TaxID=1898043 RepID=UPI000B65CA94|nr:bifunctional riboflavin kinase/FAD synthetase [Aeromicrobium sp. PE09-221]OUZ08050.1 riboflavin biosynthesis protein RibF [Aeromicrobium sp. PE09-221]
MAIWKATEGASTDPIGGPSVVTIGVFDGVHRGHQQVLAAVRSRAAARGATSVAVTFDPHPVAVLAPDKAPARLTTLDRRVELLHEHGAEEVRVLAFSAEMSAWSPQEFIDRVIVDQTHCQELIVGENFRFGRRAAGTVETLHEAGRTAGFAVEGWVLAGDGQVFSSTRARRAIAGGDLAAAASVLGRPHEISGTVTPGDRRGRELGFPTANVPVDESYAVPPDGVYAGRLVRAGRERLPAAISIGTNPTFEGVAGRRVESYVLDRDDLDLYGEAVRVELVESLRPMVAFDSVDALVVQMEADVAAARRVLD